MSTPITEAAALEFTGMDLKASEIMPTAKDWASLQTSLWMLIQVLNDNRDDLAIKLKNMQDQGIITSFFDMLDGHKAIFAACMNWSILLLLE